MIEGGKRVLIISPQPWEGFHVSKHHYAMELASRGNEVYFANPPFLDRDHQRGEIKLRDTTVTGIQSIEYRPEFPYILKFRCRWLFERLMQRQAKRISAACGGRLDVVWDFDNTYNFANLDAFHAQLKIFHPVDQLVTSSFSTKRADFVLAVSQSILDRIQLGETPARRIGHGLSQQHVAFAQQRISEPPVRTERGLRIGYVGNLLSTAIDGESMLRIVKENPDVQFEFFGPYADPNANRLGNHWTESVLKLTNSNLHGLCSQAEILTHAKCIHGWLACYDNSKDINNGADSHKILEYLATGAPVVSSHLDAYAQGELIYMPKTKSNEQLLSCFASMKRDLMANKDERRLDRLALAAQCGYSQRFSEICRFVSSTQANRERGK